MPRAPNSQSKQIAALSRAVAKLSTKKSYSKVKKGITGRGFYNGFGKDLGGALGAVGGGILGGPAGAMVGGVVGAGLGAYGSSLTGWGAYRVKHNVLSPGKPVIRNKGREGAVIIRKSEYLCDIVSSVGFAIQKVVPLNPGLSASFPWLSTSANSFQQYEWDGVIVEYKPTSGMATGSNTALGEVIMATNYDSVQPPFVNKVQMLNQEFSQSTVPSNSGIHPIECARSQTTIETLYTRSGAPAANTDIRMYDLGTTYIATQGNQTDGQVLGELWVHYNVLLFKPQVSGAEGGDPSVPCALYSLNNATSNGAVVWGTTAPAPVISDQIGLSFDTSGNLLMESGNPGSYLFNMYYQASNWNAGRLAWPGLSATNGSLTQITSNFATGSGSNSMNADFLNFVLTVDNTNLPTKVNMNTVLSNGTSIWQTGSVLATAVNSII